MSATREARTSATLPPDTLTPREEEAAELVWRGLSNVEIAARMYISSKVVETHLGSVRRKLGVNSRVGIALYVERKKHSDYHWSLQQL